MDINRVKSVRDHSALMLVEALEDAQKARDRFVEMREHYMTHERYANLSYAVKDYQFTQDVRTKTAVADLRYALMRVTSYSGGYTALSSWILEQFPAE